MPPSVPFILYGALTGTSFGKLFLAGVVGRERHPAPIWREARFLFVTSEDGDPYIFEAGEDLELLGKNSLGEYTLATPAVAHDSLFIRTAIKLYRIGTP